jgi:hypothetical protein
MEDNLGSVVIQPVVYTYANGKGWRLVSEVCCPGNHDIRVGDEPIQSGYAIYGSITRDYGTRYTITINEALGKKYVLSHDMGEDMVLPMIQAEMYESSYACSDMPPGPLQAQKLTSNPEITWQQAIGTLMSKCDWKAWIGEGDHHKLGLTASAGPPSQVAVVV